MRHIVIAERERKRQRADELDRLLADLFAGRFPYAVVEHKLVGTRPGRETSGLGRGRRGVGAGGSAGGGEAGADEERGTL